MTIDTRRWLIALPVVAAGWIGVLAVVMRVGGAAPAALVIAPPAGLLAALPVGTAIVARGPFSVTLASDDRGFVAALYDLGAPLVLPAGLTGCLPQDA